MKLNFVTRSRRWLSKHLAIPASEERCTPSTNSHVGQTVSWEDQAAERDDWKKRPLSPCTTPLSRKISSRSQQTASTAPASNYSADAGLSSPRSIPDVDHISEDDSYGIRVLHDPKPAAIVDIVFIHGLTGNSFRTWFHEPSGIHWPGDLLKEDLPDARVMTFGYDADVAHLVKHAALESISGYSNDLLASLAGIRQGVEASRKIIFVAHSLGGLVVRKALAISRASQLARLQRVEACTSGIVVLGTPHHGSDLANLARFFTRLLKFVKPTNLAAVDVLRKDLEVLGDLQRDFHTLLERRKNEMNRIIIVCVCETLPTAGILVVPKDSAVIPGELPLSIRANHQEMAVVYSPSQKSYKDITREIINIVDNYPRYSRFWADLPIFDLEGQLERTQVPLRGTFEWIRARLFSRNSTDPSPSARLIRITGKPGCGKTTMAASLFRDLSQNKSVRTVFFAFSGRDVSRRSPSNMMSALIDQLGSRGREQRQLNNYIMSSFPGGRAPADIESRCFVWLFENLTSDIVFIVDALDECDSGVAREGLVSTLADLIKASRDRPYRRTMILLNRDHCDLSFEGHDIPKDCITHLDLDKEDLMQTDLKAFTHVKIEELVKKRPAYKNFHSQLVSKVCERASNGMFLMVELVEKLLYRSSNSSPRGIDKTIGTLPVSLQQVYQRYWDAIDPRDIGQARSIMTWIVSAQRPFHLQTLSDALAHETVFDAENDDIVIENERPLDLGGDLKRLFSLLVQVGERVELIHQTVKDFFFNDELEADEQQQLLRHDRNIHIALVCLFCLMRNRANGDYGASSINTVFGVRIPPFYPYAKHYCAYHREAAGKREEDCERIREFDESIPRSSITVKPPESTALGSGGNGYESDC